MAVVTGWPVLAAAVVMMVACAQKLTQLRRDPDSPALRGVCVVLACLGAATVLGWEPAYALPTRITGIPHLARLLQHALALLAAAALQSVFLFLADPQTAGRRMLRRWLALLAALTVVTGGFAASGFSTASPAGDRVTPASVASVCAVLGYLTFAAIDVVGSATGYSRLVPSSPLRHGLRLLTTGILAGVAYGIHKGLSLVLAVIGYRWPEAAISQALAVAAMTLVAAGLALPSVGPYLSDAVRWPARYGLYRDLAPLWRAVYRINQDAILSPPPRRPSIRSMSSELHRRIVEIRFGLRTLDRFVDPAVGGDAARAASSLGVPADTARAIAQAASIADAIHRKTTTPPTDPGSPPEGDIDDVALVAVDGGPRSLVRVSRAYHGHLRLRRTGAVAPDRESGTPGRSYPRLDLPRPHELETAMPRHDMTLAGELYLMCHGDRSGRPRLHQRAIEIGLAAALLAELLYLNRLHIDGERVAPIDGAPPPDPLARRVWDDLRKETHPAKKWIAYLAETAVEDVIGRLHMQGIIAPSVIRRGLRSRQVTVWQPTDPVIAAGSWARLSVLLRQHARLMPFDAALTGLLHAVELDDALLDGDRPALEHARFIVTHLWPPLADLLTETRSLLDSEILAHRM